MRYKTTPLQQLRSILTFLYLCTVLVVRRLVDTTDEPVTEWRSNNTTDYCNR